MAGQLQPTRRLHNLLWTHLGVTRVYMYIEEGWGRGAELTERPIFTNNKLLQMYN